MNAATKPLDIIVATDDDTTGCVLVPALEGLGHRCLRARDSAELIRMALKASAQLALVDLDMGPISGAELVSLVRDVDDDLMVVPMAANSNTNEEFAVRSLGIFYYMLKPVDAEELKGVLASAERYIEPS